MRHSEEFFETGAWKGQQTDGLLNSMKLKSIFEVKRNSVEVVFVMPRAHDNQIISFDTFLC